MTLGELGATVEPMDDDLEPVEPAWFAYASALWNARFARCPAALGQPAEPDAASADGARQGIDRRRRRPRPACAHASSIAQVQGWFERFDVILTPTLTRTAIPIEERLFEPIEIEGQKVDTVRRAWYPYTHPFNLTGHPAISLPARLSFATACRWPIQLVGRRHRRRAAAPGGTVRGGAALGGAASLPVAAKREKPALA